MTRNPSTTRPLELDSSGKTVLQQLDYLRDQGPAPRVLLPDGITARVVVDGETVRSLLRDPRVSKDARTHWTHYREAGEIPGWLAPLVDVASMLTAGGEEHTRLKQLISKAFNPASITAMRPAIEGIVSGLIEQLNDRPPGVRVDLRAAYAYQIPSSVICVLFGVPDEQRPQILAHMDAVLDTSATPEAAAANGRGLDKALSVLVDTKRRHPGDDLTTRLLHVHEENGDHLTERELKDTLLLIIGAGAETTTALIGLAVKHMLQNPRQAGELITADRWEDIVEETLRGFPPITFFPMRFATEGIDVGQDVIEQGEAILIAFGGHGRDPSVHDQPSIWNPDRPDKRNHLAFGHGIHFCLGAPLARLEARIALQFLFAAFPQIEAAEPLEEQPLIPSFIAYDLAELPVRLTPAPGG